jgi:AraC-like DNA-binding protein
MPATSAVHAPAEGNQYRCGYSNQYYFSNSFKKKYGQSPSLYRKAENN